MGLELSFLDFTAGLLAFMTTLRQIHTKYTVYLLIKILFLYAFPEPGTEGLMNLFSSLTPPPSPQQQRQYGYFLVPNYSCFEVGAHALLFGIQQIITIYLKNKLQSRPADFLTTSNIKPICKHYYKLLFRNVRKLLSEGQQIIRAT